MNDLSQHEEIKKLRSNFWKLVRAGFIQYPPVVTVAQVKMMLDPCPVDVTCSNLYYLKDISINDVEPVGDKYIERSCSFGPIIVDLNFDIPSLGPVLVIEGKHRWFDAKERGETRIQAYVGDKVEELWEGKRIWNKDVLKSTLRTSPSISLMYGGTNPSPVR